MNTTIKLNTEEIKLALDFAEKIHEQRDQTNTDFGNRHINRRDQIDFKADTAEGKLAEIALSKFLKSSWGIDFQPDFEIYPGQLNIDYGQDIDIYIKNGKARRNIKRIDIKATKSYSKWLLVESHKFWSDAYVLVKVDLPRDTETNLNNFSSNGVAAEIAGYAFHFDIVDPQTKEPWFNFSNRGNNTLFHPEILKRLGLASASPAAMRQFLDESRRAKTLREIAVPLKAERNFGLPIIWLRKTWNSFAQWLESNSIAVENQIVANELSKISTRTKIPAFLLRLKYFQDFCQSCVLYRIPTT